MIFFNNLEACQAFYTSNASASQPDLNLAYQEWLEALNTAAAKEDSNDPNVCFWVVVEVPKKDFSQNIEVHPNFPLHMPIPGVGKVIGIATTKQDLDKLTLPEGPDPKTGIQKSDRRREYIHLTYKVRLRGDRSWRDLIEFCAEKDLLIEGY